jgi:hypothetical protein
MAHHKRDRLGSSNDGGFISVEPPFPLSQRNSSANLSSPFFGASGPSNPKETQAVSDTSEEPTDNEMHAQLNEIYLALEKIKEGETKLSELKERASRDIERLKGRSNSLQAAVRPVISSITIKSNLVTSGCRFQNGTSFRGMK